MAPIAPTPIVIDKPVEQPLCAEYFIQLSTVFHLLPQFLFYVKDHSRRWVTCNPTALKLLRLRNLSDVIGLREEDFFPKPIASAIREDDLTVLEKGDPIVDRIEIVSNAHGELVWAKTTKIPVQTPEGDVIGLVGFTQVLDRDAELPTPFKKFRPVVQMIENEIACMPSVSELAASAHMSESHFRRGFKQCFGLSPQEFIQQKRLRYAAKLLTQSEAPISKVALDSGFSDQSHFSRQFGRFFGETPRHYRHHWR